jgi:hypothetical protein
MPGKAMIDTIILFLTPPSFHISDPEKFTPSARWALADPIKSTRPLQSKQNPTKKELMLGAYKPRLTLTHRMHYRGGQETTLKIELSLPKLLFGNNFSELRYKDFLPVAHTLVDALSCMGVVTTVPALAHAPVSVIHYAKNIIFTDGSIPYHYINAIKEANVQLPLDVNQTDYRNEGHSYKWHCNSYEVAFYDKIKDLEYAKLSSKRSIEKDNEMQLHIFNTLRNPRKPKKFEVLRMEVRLNKRKKIKQLFNKIGIAADITFKKLFKPAIAKKVLLHYLNEIESKRPALLDYKPKNDKTLLIDLVMNNPTLKPKQLFQLYGFKQALNYMNMREIRMLLGKHNPRTWSQLIKDAGAIELPNTNSPLKAIREQLITFKAVQG